MSHERQQTLCLIRMFLQDVLGQMENRQAAVHLQEFSSDNWVLDKIFYGTEYFPRQMFASPVDGEPGRCMTGQMPQVKCDELDQCESTGSRSEYLAASQSSFEEDDRTCLRGLEIVDEEDDETSNFSENGEHVKANIVVPSNQDQIKCEAEGPVCNTGLLNYGNHDYLNNVYTDNITPIVYDEDPNTNGVFNIATSYSNLHNIQESDINDCNMYYLPQLVTYFPATATEYLPTPVTELQSDPNLIEHSLHNNDSSNIQIHENEKSSTANNAYHAFLPVYPNSQALAHLHAGIFIPQLDETPETATELGHYVGVPYSYPTFIYSKCYGTNPNMTDDEHAHSYGTQDISGKEVNYFAPFLVYQPEQNYFYYPHVNAVNNPTTVNPETMVDPNSTPSPMGMVFAYPM